MPKLTKRAIEGARPADTILTRSNCETVMSLAFSYTRVWCKTAGAGSADRAGLTIPTLVRWRASKPRATKPFFRFLRSKGRGQAAQGCGRSGCSPT